MHRRHALTALTAFSLVAAVASAQAQSDKPITVVVPVPPGGILDQVARMVTPNMGKLLGQTMVIDNRAGASGNIAAGAVARRSKTSSAPVCTRPIQTWAPGSLTKSRAPRAGPRPDPPRTVRCQYDRKEPPQT